MPSVGMRRSTRVFVPKSVGKDGGDLGKVPKVLRSGKKILQESDDDNELGIAYYKTNNGWRKLVPQLDLITSVTPRHNACPPHSVEMQESRYMRVYDRKRKRDSRSSSSSSEEKRSRLLGSVYVRKRLKNSDSPSSSSSSSSSSDSFGLKVRLFEGARVSAIDVIVDFSPDSQFEFACFLGSLLRFMRSSWVDVSGLAAFLCSEPLGDVFSRHGVHFNPVFSPRDALGNDTVSSGLCRIYASHNFVPLVWFDFCAAPLFFRSLYSVVLVRSLCVLHMIPSVSNGLSSEDDEVLDGGILSNVFILPQNNSITTENCKDTVGESNGMKVFTRRTVTRNVRRKRSCRSKRVKHTSSLGLRPTVPFKSSSQIKANGYRKSSWCSVGFDTLGNMEGACPSLAVSGSKQKQTDDAQRNAVQELKEVKSELAELSNDIGTLLCNANILVIESDRCYREGGATVMLECSTSNVWNVVVKVHGVTKYIHQAEEVMRAGATNRYTHAMIWTVENGWKLEFFDRKDWLIFKELYKECASKNLEVRSARTIPVPGVREIPNYDDGAQVAYCRPASYISFYNNEVARALAKKTPNYDIDPDDDEWLGKLNSGLVVGDLGYAEQLAADKLEEMIDLLEKYAYRNPSDVSEESKMIKVCSHLGRGDIVAAVYRYWLRKRRQKRAALLRVFECQPSRKAPLVSENIHRKRRTVKKQANQNGMGKQQHCFEAFSVEQEELARKRVEKAKSRAKESMEAAVLKRKRAQALMDNADLATYLATMAFRIAESVKSQELSGTSTCVEPGIAE